MSKDGWVCPFCHEKLSPADTPSLRVYGTTYAEEAVVRAIRTCLGLGYDPQVPNTAARKRPTKVTHE